MTNLNSPQYADQQQQLPPRSSGGLFAHAYTDRRERSTSQSLPWRRPKSSLSLFPTDDMHDQLPIRTSEMVIDDTVGHSERAHDASRHFYSHRASSGGIKGIFRRASLSIRGAIQGRPSFLPDDAIHYNQQHSLNLPQQHQHQPYLQSQPPRGVPSGGHPTASRPTTAHSTWSRLRGRRSFRHQSSPFLHHDFMQEELPRTASPYSISTDPSKLTPPYFAPVPGNRDEPPVIPANSGAAAKASVALTNEQMHRYNLRSRWLEANTSSEDGNDQESGIGIAVTLSRSEDEVMDEVSDLVSADDHISRIDFISQLPLELAIQVLAALDANALSSVCRVSRAWNKVASNKHIWRESYLRELGATYATSGPVQPNTGLGVPRVAPESDWKKIYKAKHELNKKWKGGKATPIYLHGHTDSIYCLQFDERKIITGSRDKTIRVWDMHSLSCQLVIGSPRIIESEELLEDDNGRLLHYATSGDDVRTVQSRPKLVAFSEYHDASTLCLQYDDDILVTGSSDATCLIHSVKDGYQPIGRLIHHTAAVLDLVFDDKHIVTCSKDNSICVWDRKTHALVRQLRGHMGPVNAVQMRGNTIVSCSGDFRVKLWNIDTGKNIREFVGHTKGLACSQFSEDGRYVASAGNDEVIRIWDANTGECVRQMRAHEKLVRSLHIDSISGRLVSGSYDTDIKVWDMATGNQLLDFPRWHSSWVLSAKSDYRRIVSSGQDPKILIMDFGAEVEDIELLGSECFPEGFF